MLNFVPLLIILLPISLANAQQPSQAEQDNAILDTSRTKESKITSRDREVFFAHCYRNVPPIVENQSTLSDQETPININAREIVGFADKYIYKDDVILTQGNKYLASDTLTYSDADKTVVAEGNVNFVNGMVTLYSDTIETELQTDKTTLFNADYQFHGRGGRGEADRIYDNGLDVIEFNDSTYSACPPEDNTWALDTTTLYIDNEEDMGTAYNAVLRVKDVPVFYFPYISYPLSDKRKTGLLLPSFEFAETNGFTYSQPLYINIAPEMDATITPVYMADRGTLLSTEYRYLSSVGQGTLHAENLSDDRIRDDSRYLYHFSHNGSFAKNWYASADYSRVSDDFYFSDIDTDYGTQSDNQLLQTGKISYRESNWNSELELRDFQILGDGDTPHVVEPKLAFSAYQPIDWYGLQFDWYSEITNFTHSDDDVYTGTRVHFEPTLSMPLYYNSMFITTELKYMATFYNQDIPDSNKEDWYDDLDSSVNRYIPSFKINSGINFERDFEAFGSQYKQTLVPQIQYLYVPYEEQGNIGTYDTTIMQVDYYGLFRDNRYSGYDRIADANQITIGLSSSFLNPQGEQKMRFAIGQNYYFTPSRTRLPEEQSDSASRSSLNAEFDVNYADQYFFHTGLILDADDSEIEKANATLERRWLHDTYAQINYRYIAVPDNDDRFDRVKGIVKQLGSKVNWAINSQWTTFASYYYDLEYSHHFEQTLGIKYQSCCWAFGLTYDNHMLPYYGNIDTLADDYETEDSIGITFELMGLGGAGDNPHDSSLFDYGRPFYLQ